MVGSIVDLLIWSRMRLRRISTFLSMETRPSPPPPGELEWVFPPSVSPHPFQLSPESFARYESIQPRYNLLFRKPVGDHVIKVCDSVSCWMCGYEEVRDRLRERLGVEFGGTTDDGRFTLLPVVCLGNCDNAPTLMVDVPA